MLYLVNSQHFNFMPAILSIELPRYRDFIPSLIPIFANLEQLTPLGKIRYRNGRANLATWN